jgi:hypothetical protein
VLVSKAVAFSTAAEQCHAWASIHVYAHMWGRTAIDLVPVLSVYGVCEIPDSVQFSQLLDPSKPECSSLNSEEKDQLSVLVW